MISREKLAQQLNAYPRSRLVRPAIARLRSAKYFSLSLKLQGILEALHALHLVSGEGWMHLLSEDWEHLIFFKRLFK